MFLVFLISPSTKSQPALNTSKSANLPGVIEPSAEKIPSVFAASAVAARKTCAWRSQLDFLAYVERIYVPRNL